MRKLKSNEKMALTGVTRFIARALRGFRVGFLSMFIDDFKLTRLSEFLELGVWGLINFCANKLKIKFHLFSFQLDSHRQHFIHNALARQYPATYHLSICQFIMVRHK